MTPPSDLGGPDIAGLAGVAALGAFVNLVSPSLPERLLWVPVTAVLAVAAWHESRSVRQRRRWPVLRMDDDRRSVDVPRERGSAEQREPISA